MNSQDAKPKSKSCFIDGPIKPSFIGEQIANHQSKTGIGAHSIFLGQVRADQQAGKVVEKIDYSTYEEMANEAISKIREDAFSKNELSCLHIYHSKGCVLAGEISLFVFVSSAHRKQAMEVMKEVVEKIKKNVPVWKKEIMVDKSSSWVG